MLPINVIFKVMSWSVFEVQYLKIVLVQDFKAKAKLNI